MYIRKIRDINFFLRCVVPVYACMPVHGSTDDDLGGALDI